MKVYTGKVISTKMNHAVVVAVDRMFAHPKYLKRVRRTSKFHAQTDKQHKVGDVVQIGEVRPVSKTVTFKVI